MRTVKPTDLGRRAEAILAGDPGQFAFDDTLELPLLRGERLAGRVLTRVVVSAGLLTVLTAIVGAALAWLGVWQPLVALVVLLTLAGLSWRVSAVVPTRALPVWAALALLVVSLGATTWAGLTHDEQLLPRGEAGVNAQAAVSLAQHHQWPIALSTNAFGGPEVLRTPGLTLESPGFRQVGPAAEPAVEPRALIGGPLWLSVGFWAGGVTTMLWVPAVFGGLFVLAIGLLTSSVVGPRWGPLGALATAICFPVLHAARATSADVVVLFVICTGLLLLVAAIRAGARGHTHQAQAVGFLAGALVASGSLFRPDAVGQTILLVPVAALLVIRRDDAGAPAIWGAGSATALSGLTGVALSSGLLREQRSSLIWLGLFAFGLALLAVVAVVTARRGARIPDRARAWLPRVAAALAMVGGLALLAPPSREALAWTSWWTGPYALALTVVVVAFGAHNLTRAWFAGERLPAWTGALVVGLGAALLHWRSPAGGATSPWVSGGVVLAVPFVAVAVCMATAWATRWSTRRLPSLAVVVVSVGAAALLLVPEAAATWPHADERVSRGQVAAVAQVCRELGPADLVLMVDDRAADEWLPTVRATCDVPALSLTAATRSDPAARASAVAAVSKVVSGSDGRLVIMAAGSVAPIADLAVRPDTFPLPIPVVAVMLTQDPGHVAERPDGLEPLPVRVWLAAVG